MKNGHDLGDQFNAVLGRVFTTASDVHKLIRAPLYDQIASLAHKPSCRSKKLARSAGVPLGISTTSYPFAV
jgi:hypothetical protein